MQHWNKIGSFVLNTILSKAYLRMIVHFLKIKAHLVYIVKKKDLRRIDAVFARTFCVFINAQTARTKISMENPSWEQYVAISWDESTAKRVKLPFKWTHRILRTPFLLKEQTPPSVIRQRSSAWITFRIWETRRYYFLKGAAPFPRYAGRRGGGRR